MELVNIPPDIRATLKVWAVAAEHVINRTNGSDDTKVRMRKCRETLLTLAKTPSPIVLMSPQISFAKVRFIAQILTTSEPDDDEKLGRQIRLVSQWMDRIEAGRQNSY